MADVADGASRRPRDAEPDARPRDPAELEAQLSALEESRAVWEALRMQRQEAYWYEEENCGGGSLEGTVTVVQVQDGKAARVATRSIALEECEGALGRYEDFSAQKLDVLYEQCARLIEQSPDTEVAFDAEGIVRSCTLWTPPPGCFDACGEGFWLRARGFGEAPAAP